MVCRFLKGKTKELVIMLDQFEEFFRFSLDAEQRRIYIRELAACYDDKTLPVRWLISLRKDYFSDLAEVERISPSLQVFRNEYLLSTMTRKEAQEAIIGPVEKLDASVRYAPDLLETLLANLEHSDMELPLLQMLCTQLYEQRTSRQDTLTLEAYEALGRTEGVLRRYLREVLAALPEQEGALAKTILKALVRSDGLKQHASERALAAHAGVQMEQLESILGHLVNARLLRPEDVEGEHLYELVHEYLITEISTWIEPADMEFKQVEELLQREMINWRVHRSIIPKDRLEVLYKQRGRLTRLDSKTWACLLYSAFAANFAVKDWVYAASNSDMSVVFKMFTSLFSTPLTDEDNQIRVHVVQALGEIHDERAIEPLIAALQDKAIEVRLQAAQALGKLQDPRAVEPFLAALCDEDESVRLRAAEILGTLQDPRAVEPLLATLRDKEESVREEAARALGHLQDARAVEPLIAILQNEDWLLRADAMRALGNLRDPRAVHPLLAVLHDEDPEMREEAVRALGNLRDPRAVQPLLAALRDSFGPVRGLAAEALRELKDTRILEFLIDALKNKDEHELLGWQAAEALGILQDVRAVEPLLAALRDRSTEVRRHAARSLGSLGDPRAVEPLLAALRDRSTEVRGQAARALGKLQDVIAVEPLIAILQSKDGGEPLRASAAEALGILQDVRAVEPLLAALKDGSVDVRMAAADALGELKDTRAVEPLITILQNKNENEYMRLRAVEVLGTLKDVRAVKPLTAFLRELPLYETEARTALNQIRTSEQ